ncbi:MAG: UvrD-helicase domain-containing protein [Desulfobacterales bacterium]
MTRVIDQSERIRALDPEKSFIVQAPAGSGKTGLLIQRYLCLLAGVKHPEEVLAVTFTRKAAAEMRNRVLSAIAGADGDTPPEKDHERLTWELARKARQRDAQEGWRVEKYPSRMRIMTIDSLCAGLTRQMPVLSGFGAPAGIADDPGALYAKAARNTAAELEGGGSRSQALQILALHLDNRISDVENLLSLMLPHRDQWLRHVANTRDTAGLRSRLESAIQGVITRALSELRGSFPRACVADTLELCTFAAKNLSGTASGSMISQAAGLKDLPGTAPCDLPAWQAIAELFLTKDGSWRKKVDKNQGFPAAGSAGGDPDKKAFFDQAKRRFKKLVAELSRIPGLAENLDSVRRLPAPGYTDEQWAVLEALFDILKLAAAHLQTVFQQEGRVDFAEVAIRACTALGDPDDPTDLALSMDYRISHILIDEFQDTSISQFELMRGLTAGWSAGDGRSFFAVGDPMQSIYGFREAEVGLFLKAWQKGLDAHLPLEPVVLKSNFRSERGIVKWVNEVFPQVMPENGDPDTGAVPYMPAHPAVGQGEGRAVSVHALIEHDEQQEAEQVTECIRQALAENQQQTVAVLVRSRPHLKAVLPELRRAGLRFSAVEIDSLAQRPVVRDLLSLTRALCHPADRPAWLGVLRAPWCGLSLDDLYTIAGTDHKTSVFTLIHDEERVASLSADGRRRLLRVRPVLDASAGRIGRRSLRRIVEGAWLALGGPAAASDEAALDDAAVYLDFLESRADTEPVSDIDGFEQGVFELFAAPDPGADQRLQIMTIHKAKGLEFDTVIIPGLSKAPRSSDPSLLLWQELADAPPEESLLMAPISETGAEKDRTYNYIHRLRQAKSDYETGRLLYVAATRAKKRLHLFARAFLDRSGRLCRPVSRCLLGVLWPAVCGQFEAAAEKKENPGGGENNEADLPDTPPGLLRLPPDMDPPGPPEDVSVSAGKTPPIRRAVTETDLPEFEWAGITLRRVGTVVHRWLRVICEQGLENWDSHRVQNSAGLLRKDLLRAGIAPSDIDDALARASGALLNAVADETGRWILSARGSGACEYAVSGVEDGVIVSAVIDRTFVDESGVRWIIDYKSGIHSGGGIDEFLDREQQRYSTQMQRYARLMEKICGRPVRLGLYFPMIPAWRQWETGKTG